jgi:PiT family inorganic phosphate transporter
MPHFWHTIEFNLSTFSHLSATVWSLIVLALVFDFLNGFHDSANSVATVVSTRVLSPQAAVIWAAFFNFVAFLVLPLNVANVMGKGIIDPAIVNNHVIAATLIAACAWDVITWYWGLPTSSSHALMGGMAGAALVQSGVSALVLGNILKTVVFIFVAPVLGFAVAVAIAVVVFRYFHNSSPRRVDGVFRKGQLVSAALYSLGHGGNDAQKTMGIIWVLLIAASQGGDAFPTPQHVPTEVVLACHTAMGLGTLCGGWRIVKTMGQRIIHLRPVDGFCAETGAAATLMLTLHYGIPVSTTHTITGAIVGVGTLKRMSAVRWGVAGQVVWAWILTIPGAALISVGSWWVLTLLFGPG